MPHVHHNRVLRFTITGRGHQRFNILIRKTGGAGKRNNQVTVQRSGIRRFGIMPRMIVPTGPQFVRVRGSPRKVSNPRSSPTIVPKISPKKVSLIPQVSPTIGKYRNKIEYHNRLAGPAGVPFTGPPLSMDTSIPWIPEFEHAFAISMRSQRWQGLVSRLGPWASKVHLFPATNGEVINKNQWIKNGKIHPGCTLTRGQMGCYDSHVRVWQTIVQDELPLALILEDDVNLRYREDTYQRLRRAFDEITQYNITWDIFYLGRSPGHGGISSMLSPSIGKTVKWTGLFCYVVTYEGAKKLISKAVPYHLPVDVYIGGLLRKNIVQGIQLSPSLCYVVPVHSDTGGIK